MASTLPDGDRSRRRCGALGGLAVLLAWAPAHAGQPLETETARFLRRGQLQTEAVLEFQTSSEGTETAVPLALEYGIADSLQFLIEPVVVTAIRPKTGRGATGFGDLEMTLGWRFVNEGRFVPALAIAGEVKAPTASNTLIGTGATDYSPFLIASKQFGSLDTHLNFGYAILGNPSGVKLDNIFTYAAAAEYHLNDSWDVVAEVIGNTSSSPRSTQPTPSDGETPADVSGRASAAEASGETSVIAEAAGAEVSGLMGTRYYLKPNFFLSLGLTYDNNSAFLVRPGITYVFDLFH